MSHPDRQQWLDAAVAAAASAATFIAQEAQTLQAIEWTAKSATDFVSHVDIGAEERIRAQLQLAIPDLHIIGEELGQAGHPESGLVAIVDPLDGTTNFLHGFPSYGVSICIALDGVPQAAVIHDVARGGVYSATAGDGAFVDGRQLRVSSTQDPARALIGTGFPFRDISYAEQYLAQMHRLMPQVAGIRRAGSAALDLADVARGRFDGFWEQYLHPWDHAAGLLLVREAGGRVTDYDGSDARVIGGTIVASNGHLHEWFLDLLTR